MVPDCRPRRAGHGRSGGREDSYRHVKHILDPCPCGGASLSNATLPFAYRIAAAAACSATAPLAGRSTAIAEACSWSTKSDNGSATIGAPPRPIPHVGSLLVIVSRNPGSAAQESKASHGNLRWDGGTGHPGSPIRTSPSSCPGMRQHAFERRRRQYGFCGAVR